MSAPGWRMCTGRRLRSSIRIMRERAGGGRRSRPGTSGSRFWMPRWRRGHRIWSSRTRRTRSRTRRTLGPSNLQIYAAKFWNTVTKMRQQCVTFYPSVYPLISNTPRTEAPPPTISRNSTKWPVSRPVTSTGSSMSTITRPPRLSGAISATVPSGSGSKASPTPSYRWG